MKRLLVNSKKLDMLEVNVVPRQFSEVLTTRLLPHRCRGHRRPQKEAPV